MEKLSVFEKMDGLLKQFDDHSRVEEERRGEMVELSTGSLVNPLGNGGSSKSGVEVLMGSHQNLVQGFWNCRSLMGQILMVGSSERKGTLL